METGKFQPPEDEVESYTKMTRAEFLAAYSNRSISMTVYGSTEDLFNDKNGKVLHSEDLGDAIMCDLCGVDPLDSIYMVWSKAICQACADKIITPYIK